MGQYGAFRFGWDAPHRIGTSVSLLAEQSALLPAEPVYQPLIPFYPAIVSGSTSASGVNATDDDWVSYPGRLDLFCYQGDDVQIPLYFQNPSDLNFDISNENLWNWKAQIRVLHTTRSTLVNEFAVESEFLPEDPTNPDDLGVTKVTLFLPRTLNTYVGQFHWDLQSVSPFVGPDYPRPENYPEEEPWPPDDLIRTWLYGIIKIVPRVTATDVIPPSGELPIGNGGAVPAPFAGPFVVGPNGRVP